MMGAKIMMKTLLPMTMMFPSIASLGWQESNSNRLRGANKQGRMHHDIAILECAKLLQKKQTKEIVR